MKSRPKPTLSELNAATTGIGSLPHHNIDSALEFSFQTSLPFLPQIPIRNPWEFMIAQALEGITGLLVEKDGAVTLDRAVWEGRAKTLDDRLQAAFRNASSPDAFEAFEPSAATSSLWQPFLWELQEQGKRLAKIQIAGPLTCQRVLRAHGDTKSQAIADQLPGLGTQIYRLILARAIAMCRRLLAEDIQPVIYLDEPGLYVFSRSSARDLAAYEELKLMIQALRKEGAWVGLHCCSNTDWQAVLELGAPGLQILSIDAGLSLKHLLSHGDELAQFVQSGGRLSLGVIPGPADLDTESLYSRLLETLDQGLGHLPSAQKIRERLLQEALFTPACGLALQTPEEANAVLSALLRYRSFACAPGA